MAWRLTSGLRCLAHEGLPAHPASPDRHDRDAVWPRSSSLPHHAPQCTRGGTRTEESPLTWVDALGGRTPAPMPATGTTRGNLRGFGGRGGRFSRGGGIARRGPAVGLTSGGVGARRPTLIAG